MNNEGRSYVYKVELQSDMFNDARVMASKWIEPGSWVLDVGCACGDFGEFLHKVKNVQIHGFEYDRKSLEQAASKGIYKSLSQVDLNFFDAHAYSDLHGKFDVVALIDVLEHTISPETVIESLKFFLKPGGVFVVSLPNASFGEVKGKLLHDNFEYTEVGVLDKTHIRFYTFNTIANLFSSAALKVTDCGATVGLIDKFLFDLPYCVKKYIKRNPRSYIFQYIFIARPSLTHEPNLRSKNILAMDLGWETVDQPLRVIKGNEMLNFLFPAGTRRRRLAREIIRVFRGKRRDG